MQKSFSQQLTSLIRSVGQGAEGIKFEKGSGTLQEKKDETSLIGNAEQALSESKISGPKVGRNDPCPCGSGKKFKHCHGA